MSKDTQSIQLCARHNPETEAPELIFTFESEDMRQGFVNALLEEGIITDFTERVVN